MCQPAAHPVPASRSYTLRPVTVTGDDSHRSQSHPAAPILQPGEGNLTGGRPQGVACAPGGILGTGSRKLGDGPSVHPLQETWGPVGSYVSTEDATETTADVKESDFSGRREASVRHRSPHNNSLRSGNRIRQFNAAQAHRAPLPPAPPC